MADSRAAHRSTGTVETKEERRPRVPRCRGGGGGGLEVGGADPGGNGRKLVSRGLDEGRGQLENERRRRRRP